MITLSSYRSAFSEPFSVLLPKPESFQLFPQRFKIGISSGLWVEISSGPWHCCPVPHEWRCLVGQPASLPRATQVPLQPSGMYVASSNLKMVEA